MRTRAEADGCRDLPKGMLRDKIRQRQERVERGPAIREGESDWESSRMAEEDTAPFGLPPCLSTMQIRLLKEGDVKFACWLHEDNIETGILTKSSGIFVDRPVDGLEEPEISLYERDTFEIRNSCLEFAPLVRTFQNGLSGYLLEFDHNGRVISESDFWRFCEGPTIGIDESQQHLLLLTNKTALIIIRMERIKH